MFFLLQIWWFTGRCQMDNTWYPCSRISNALQKEFLPTKMVNLLQFENVKNNNCIPVKKVQQSNQNWWNLLASRNAVQVWRERQICLRFQLCQRNLKQKTWTLHLLLKALFLTFGGEILKTTQQLCNGYETGNNLNQLVFQVKWCYDIFNITLIIHNTKYRWYQNMYLIWNYPKSCINVPKTNKEY